MDKKAVSFLVLGTLIGVVVASGLFSVLSRGTSAGDSGKTVLKLAHVLPPAAPVHKGMEFMAQRVHELSGGLVEVQIFPSGQLGSETETIEQLQRGALAMVKTSAAAMEGFVPEMSVFGIPYLFQDKELYWSILNSDLGQELLEKGVSVNIRGLCYYDAGARSFYTVHKPILSPENLEGQKIRTMRSQTAMEMIKVMGGAPTAMPFGELYTGLQQGMVDGAENNPPSVYDSRHWEVAKYYSLDEHTRIPDLLIFSEQIWESLSPQIQSWLKQAAEESVVYQRKIWADYEAECIEKLEKEGVTVYTPEKMEFQKAVEPMYRQHQGTVVGDLIQRVREMQ